MEKKTYRQNYEMLREMFPEQMILGIKEVQQITGWGRERVLRTVPMQERKWISVASMANFLAS